MSRKGDCYDNAVAESFFSTLEFELGADADWQTRDQATAAVRDYIDGFYNPVRRHSTIGGLSPIAFEQRHATAQEKRGHGGSAPEPPQTMDGSKEEDGSGKKAA
jgi:putative transposase